MNPFGQFQGFGAMRRKDFEPGAAPAARRGNPYNSTRGNGNTNPYGTAGNRGLPASANIPAQYPEGVSGRQPAFPAMKQGNFATPSTSGAAMPLAPRPAQARTPRPAPPVTQRPAAVTVPGGSIEADYAVPPGSTPLPSRAPEMPAAAVAARPGVMMAPVGASRNEQLVQAAGNAGMRLVSPQAMAVASGQPERPMVSNDGARRMLSEFGSGRPALTETPAMNAQFDAGAALPPQTLEAAAAGFQAGAAAAGGDRFAHLRPDIAEWARAHENSAKGVDGKNIVDRFMEKQGAAPPLPPVSFPAQDMSLTPQSFGQREQPLVDTGVASVDPAILQATFRPNALQAASANFATQEVNPVEQVNLLREMYRQHTRPAPALF
jgi:hypothetical protein